MTRILVAECKQEVSSFNPAPSHLADFTFTTGADILAIHRGAQSEMGGALSVFEATDGIALVPAFSGRSITSGGTLAAADWDELAAMFLDRVRTAPAMDAVYFSLHGAMSAANEDDPEGYLLQETREIVGENIPLVVSLDLHGILTDRMLRHADAVVVYHTYPHVDFFETGARAARVLLRILDGFRPVTAKVTIPALVRGNELITATGKFGEFIRACQGIEASPGGLSAGMFIGNPFTDVPELCSDSVVVTDDADRSTREAVRLAEAFWNVRAQLQQPLTGLDAAVRIAKETPDGTVVLMDAADATSSGASGDSNAILRALIAHGYTGSALIPIIDPRAVADAFAAGVGNLVTTMVGGAFDPARFPPLPITGRVHLLAEGRFISEFNMMEVYSGPTAVVKADNFTLVLGTRPVSLHDRSFYLAHGQIPEQFALVVVKSPHCKPPYYEEWATRLINVDAPGATSANLPTLGHTKCRRPIFPLDANVPFTPQVQIFRRETSPPAPLRNPAGV